MLALDEHQQSLFVGIRSTFYRIAQIVGQGLLVILAGYLKQKFNNIALAWSVTFYGIAAFFICIAIYHYFILPKPNNDNAAAGNTYPIEGFISTFTSFFHKKGIILSLAFVLLYRLGEAQLVKIASPFMLDPIDKGGLGLSTSDVGFVYGTVGIIALTVGGILGGIAAATHGLKNCLWTMVLAMNIPNLVYVYFAYAQPTNYAIICSGVAIEQFGYGFGFTAFMLYLIYISKGEFKTAHYAICTGFMALGMMLPGLGAGIIQESIGYLNFFIWVCICTIPGFILTIFLKIDKQFGIKQK